MKKEKLKWPTNPFLQFEWELNQLIKKFEKKSQANIRGYFVIFGKNVQGDHSNFILASNISVEKIYESVQLLRFDFIEGNIPMVFSRTDEEIEKLEREEG